MEAEENQFLGDRGPLPCMILWMDLPSAVLRHQAPS